MGYCRYEQQLKIIIMIIIATIPDIQEAVRDIIKKEIQDLLSSFKSADNLLSKSEAAEFLGISVSSVDNRRRNGELQSYNVSGRVKFKMEDLTDFINSKTFLI